MIRIGDKFKDGRTGKVFTVTVSDPAMFILEAEDGSLERVIVQEPTQPCSQNEEEQNI